MGFLSPIFLWMIPLALIPLFIHLYNKRNYVTIEFSTLKFLKLIEKESINKIDILQIILLILRIIIVILIVLMITRPVLNTFFLNTNTSTQQTIILDDSFSMKNKDNEILNISKIILEQINDNDELLWINTNSGIQFSGLKKNLQDSKELIKSTFLSNSLSNIFKTVNDYNKNTYSQNEYYFITDMQFNNIEKFNKFIEKNKNMKGYIFTLPNTKSNMSIINAKLSNDIIVPDIAFKIEVDIKNNGIENIENHHVQLIVDNIAVGQQTVSINAGKIKTIFFETSTPRTGFHSMEIFLQNDDINEDNKFYLSFYVPELIDIAFLETNEESTYYIKKSIDVLNSKSKIFNINKYSLNDLKGNQSNLFKNNLIISHPSIIANHENSDFNEYLFNGGHIILFPSNNTTPNDFKRLSDNFDLNGNFNKLKYTQLNQSYQEINYETIPQNHINKIFNGEENRNIRFFNFFSLPYLPENSELTLKDNSAIWNSYNIGNGLLDIFSFSLNLEWTNFPLKGSYLPVIHYLLCSSSKKDDIKNLTVDDSWGIRMNEYISSKLIHIDPNGDENIISKIKNDFIETDKLNTPGIHTISTDNQIISKNSVNISQLELNQENINLDQIKSALAENVFIVHYEDNITQKLANARKGNELWRIILYLITILLMIEMFISNPIKKH